MLFQLIYLAAFLVITATAQLQKCYYPDGTYDPTLAPCKSAQEHSACCGADTSLCLDNGLCFKEESTWGNRLSRGGCTDKTWKSGACPQYCADGMQPVLRHLKPSKIYSHLESVNMEGGCSLFLGPESTTGAFCCALPYDTEKQKCINSTFGTYEPFDMVSGKIQFDRVHGNTRFAAAFGLNSVSSAVSGSTDSCPVATTSTVTTTTTASSTAAAAQDTSGERSRRETVIGAGIGVPLFVVLLLALSSLAWMRRRYRQLQDELERTRKEFASLSSAPYFVNAGSQRLTMTSNELNHENIIVEANEEGLVELGHGERR